MASNATLLKMIQALTARVVKLETAPPGTATIPPEIVALPGRVTALEQHVCPQEDRITRLEG